MNDTKIFAKELVECLIKNKMFIATAESCTGGKIASAIIDIPDASKVFYEGIVSYSNDAKVKRLNVSQNDLDKVGAVSSEVATQMAENLLNKKVGLAISTTGIAGPLGGTEDKPVGLVFIGIAGKNGTVVYKEIFDGNRNEIRDKATSFAIKKALLYIQNQ